MWVLYLNDMRGPKSEVLTPAAWAESRQALEDLVERELVAGYVDSRPPREWSKNFRTGGPLEWFNPPDSYGNAAERHYVEHKGLRIDELVPYSVHRCDLNLAPLSAGAPVEFRPVGSRDDPTYLVVAEDDDLEPCLVGQLGKDAEGFYRFSAASGPAVTCRLVKEVAAKLSELNGGPDKWAAVPERQNGAVVYPPDGTESPFTVINLGSGQVRMGCSLHDGRLVSLWFGRDGKGVGHAEDLYREARDGETIAVVTFSNVASLDVLQEVLGQVRTSLLRGQPGSAAEFLERERAAASQTAQEPVRSFLVDGFDGTRAPIGNWSDGPETYVIVKAKDVGLGVQTYHPAKACQGKNCGTTDGLAHSAECLAEYEAAIREKAVSAVAPIAVGRCLVNTEAVRPAAVRSRRQACGSCSLAAEAATATLTSLPLTCTST